MFQIVHELFGDALTGAASQKEFCERFFARPLSIADLRKVHDFITAQSVVLGEGNIPSVFEIVPEGTQNKERAAILAQTHGNEPSGLAGILLALALAEAGYLQTPLYAIISTPIAARQYFEAYERAPGERQESRDLFRRGYGPDGALLRDPNRIPPDFREHPEDPHNARAVQLDALAGHFQHVLDIHSARGDLICVTDHVVDRHLLYGPIRGILTGLMGSIADHSGTKTYKSIFLGKPNIKSCIGIEAGTHEDPMSFRRAAEFTMAWLYNIGASTLVPPRAEIEDGRFFYYRVGRSLSFAGLEMQPSAGAYEQDLFYTVKPCGHIGDLPPGVEELIVERDEKFFVIPRQGYNGELGEGILRYAVHQFAELERVERGQIVAVGVPSGARLRAKESFHALFVAKPAKLYADKAAGVLPVSFADFSQKFCYPCQLEQVKIPLP